MTDEEIDEKGSAALAGIRVLIVEDEYYVADDIRRALSAAGATVIGPIGNLSSAQAAVEAGGFDWAIMDLNLGGESAVDLIDQLVVAGRPFVIGTGYSESSVPQRLHQYPRLRKPFDPQQLIDILKGLASA